MSEPRVHRWSSNEAAPGPMWRHGRARISVRGAGRRWKYGSPATNPRWGERGDLGVACEWRLLPAAGFGLGFKVKWGTNGSETTPDVSLHLGRVGDLWLHFENVVPYRWLERRRPDGSTDYDTRVFSVNVSTSAFRWQCWARDGHWSSTDPWWMAGSVRFRQLLFGRTAHTREVLDDGTCVVPMPEANYPATFTVTRHTSRYERPLGRARDRMLGARTHCTVEIKPGAPIPVPGKGENAWDCGDDAFYSTTAPGTSVEEAIGHLVASALRQRRRHGGEHMNTPRAVQ